MTAVLEPATTTSATGAPSSTNVIGARSRAGGSPTLAKLFVAAPALLATAVLLHPDDTHGAGRTLADIAGDDRGRWIAAHLLEPFSWLLLGVVLLFTLPRLAPGRGRRLAAPAGILGVIGAVAIGFIVYAHGEAFVFMTNTHISHHTLAPLFDQFEDKGMPLAAIPSLGYRLGVLLGGIGLFRARTIPRWAAVLLSVSAVTLSAGSGAPLAVSVVLAIGPLLAVAIASYRTIATTGGPALPGATV